jgi:4-diphosphocytidyl-2-C-methyl-D-erythritol kinase
LIRLQAHAKINLCLGVIGRRPDGLHEIETLVQTISLHDTLTLQAADEGISLRVDDPAIPPGPDNLAWRAAAALPPPPRSPRGVRLALRKRIPAGAGLGGGSADAAATLIGLRALWNLDLSDRELESIGSTLGADVPFFLHGGTALLTGTGTDVEPLQDRLGYQILVVFPAARLATREVYARVAPSLTSSLKISSMARFSHTLKGNLPAEVESWVRAGNDLEPIARSLCPLIGDVVDRLRSAGATAASMTGSGSAVFGIFRDHAALQRALDSERAAGLAATRCEPLGRLEYRRDVGLG